MDATANADQPSDAATAHTAESPSLTRRLQLLHMSPRAWLIAVIVLIALEMFGRIVVLTGRTFYWDDFIIVGTGMGESVFAPDYLFQNHDGHLAPLAFFVQGLINKLAPWQWWIPAVLMALGQVAVTAASAVALRRIAGRTWVAYGALALASLTPLTMPGSTWWSAAVNSLPMQFAFAVVVAVFIRISFDRFSYVELETAPTDQFIPTAARLRPRHLVGCSVVLLLALGFFEKSLAIVPVTLLLIISIAYLRRVSILETLRKGATLWITLTTITVGWAVLYFFSSLRHDFEATSKPLIELFFGGLGQIFAGLVGGPWIWERWVPGQPFADAPPSLILIGGMLVLFVSAISIGRDIRAWAPWTLATTYTFVVLLLLLFVRSGEHTSGTLAHTLHYYSDVVLVIAMCAATAFTSHPPKEVAPPPLPRRTRELVLALVAVVFVSSAVSVFSYRNAWADDRTAGWLRTTTQALEEARAADDAPILDQQVPYEILLPLTAPNNTYAHVFDDIPLDRRPEFSHVTTLPRMFNNDGDIVAAGVSALTKYNEGDSPECGHRLEAAGDGTASVEIPLTDIVKLGDWVAEFNATASTPLTVRLSLPNPFETEEQTLKNSALVSIDDQLERRWVAVTGGGNILRVELVDASAGDSICFGSGSIGPLVPDSLRNS